MVALLRGNNVDGDAGGCRRALATAYGSKSPLHTETGSNSSRSSLKKEVHQATRRQSVKEEGVSASSVGWFTCDHDVDGRQIHTWPWRRWLSDLARQGHGNQLGLSENCGRRGWRLDGRRGRRWHLGVTAAMLGGEPRRVRRSKQRTRGSQATRIFGRWVSSLEFGIKEQWRLFKWGDWF